jgi:8-amino-7-oxononanoate synthase
MIDCTSSLYLGLRHGSGSLGAWPRLSTGVPAALGPPAGAEIAGRGLARLAGCRAGVLAPSTLHLFWDLFGILACDSVAIHADAGLYPIGRWGVERAAARGARVRAFRHHDPDALGASLGRSPGLRPLVVADGFCPACGRPAPIREYLELLRPRGGLLILDDTQALGIFGHEPGPGAPYGRGGGGSVRRAGIAGPDVAVVSSLAKGFGVPVAVLAASRAFVARFERESETRVHCSPASIPAMRAAARALRVNARHGDALRLRLARNVRRFRRRLAEAGVTPGGGLFAVQALAAGPRVDPPALHRRLLGRGIRTVLQRPERLLVILRADHAPREIDALAGAILGGAPARGSRSLGAPCLGRPDQRRGGGVAQGSATSR